MKLPGKESFPIVLTLGIAFTIVAFDQVSKSILLKLGWPVVTNLGVAFGLFPSERWGGIGLIVVGTIVAWIIKDRHRLDPIEQFAYGLIVGGGLANLTDRYLTGSVRDFILWSWLPAFNLADLVIVVGVGLIFIRAGKFA